MVPVLEVSELDHEPQATRTKLATGERKATEEVEIVMGVADDPLNDLPGEFERNHKSISKDGRRRG